MDTRQLPAEPPDGWVASHPVWATHYLTRWLLHPGREGNAEFSDVWRSYQQARDQQTGGALSARTAKVKGLGIDRFVVLADYEPAIKSSWCSPRGLIEVSAPETVAGSCRNDLDRVLVDLGMGSALLHLDRRGFVAAKPYSRAERDLHRMTDEDVDRLCDTLMEHPEHGDLFALAFILRSTPKQSRRPSADVLQAHRVLSRYARLGIWKAERALREAMLRQGFGQS